MKNSKIKLFNGSDDQFYFNLTAKNGEIIGQSEGYSTKQGALNGIDAVIVNSQVETRHKLFRGEDNQYYFHLRGANNRIVLQSEGYVTKQGAMNGITSVNRNASGAVIVDLTVD